MYLAVSVTIPLQARILFSVGSGIFGYIVGLLCMSYGNLSVFAAVMAFASAALASSIFGSLHKWANGGPTPRWILFLKDLSPFGMKKGGGSE